MSKTSIAPPESRELSLMTEIPSNRNEKSINVRTRETKTGQFNGRYNPPQHENHVAKKQREPVS